jgi:LysR family glycine cleavage system transcriptional activator
MDLVDFRKDDVDAAIRYGRGQWPGVSATWLMADDLFPVCSPALLAGPHPLRGPQDLAHHALLHTSGFGDDWRLWLTAAGLPAEAARPGLTFDLSLMTVQAAIDGLGVAIGRTSYVKDDIDNGRLVVPFDIALPADAGFYLVSPKPAAKTPKLAVFADWLVSAAQRSGARPIP